MCTCAMLPVDAHHNHLLCDSCCGEVQSDEDRLIADHRNVINAAPCNAENSGQFCGLVYDEIIQKIQHVYKVLPHSLLNCFTASLGFMVDIFVLTTVWFMNQHHWEGTSLHEPTF